MTGYDDGTGSVSRLYFITGEETTGVLLYCLMQTEQSLILLTVGDVYVHKL